MKPPTILIVEDEGNRRSKWHLSYFVLAGLNLLTVLGAFYLSYRGRQILAESVQVNRQWADRLKRYSDLGQAAATVNAPGNDVFDSRDVPAEAARMTKALHEFNLRLAEARADLVHHGSADATVVLGQMGDVEFSMLEMVGEANLIFSYFNTQRPDKAGERMATMDRTFARLNERMVQIRDTIAGIQSAHFDSQTELAESVKRYEMLIGGLIFLLAASAAIYGAQVSREREAAAAALRKSEDRYRGLVTEMTDGVFTADASGLLTFANPALTRLLGFEHSEEVVGRRWIEFIAPARRNEIGEYFRHAVESGKTREMVVTEIARPDGMISIAEIRFTAGMEGGRVVLIKGVIRDVTGRVRADEALRQSLRDKEMLLKEVHHRVKNSLSVVTSLLRIEARKAEHDVTKSVLTGMQDRIQSIALLYETLYRSGTFGRVDLASYLSQLAHQLFRSLVVHPGTVRLNLDLTPVQVETDRAISCGLMVNELVTNSLKHGFPDGRTGDVRICLREAGDGMSVTLSVSDSGAGLPRDFDVKRQGSLGLQLVSDLARQIQGSLKMGPGPTAAFEVTFNPTHTQATVEIPPPDGQASRT